MYLFAGIFSSHFCSYLFVMNVYVGHIFRAINFELEPQNTPITGCTLPDFDAYSFYSLYNVRSDIISYTRQNGKI